MKYITIGDNAEIGVIDTDQPEHSDALLILDKDKAWDLLRALLDAIKKAGW